MTIQNLIYGTPGPGEHLKRDAIQKLLFAFIALPNATPVPFVILHYVSSHDLLIKTLLITFPLSECKSWLLAEFISVLTKQASVKHQNIS